MELLGPVLLHSKAGVLAPRGLRALLLISLLAARGRAVTYERLSAELWGMERAEGSDNRLHTSISKLRYELHWLEPERAVPRLRRIHGGYVLDLDGISTDADEFMDGVARLERLERQATTARPASGAELARHLLRLWRGPVFGGLVGGPICQDTGHGYEQARLRTLELLYDMELDNGRHSAIVADLSELAMTRTTYQYQESFCEQAMIALYRSGRQADAIDLYHRVREDLLRTNTAVTQRLRRCNRAIQGHAALLRQPRPRAALARAS
jgi:DNA-binding SARP family transcriptional activator